MTGDNVTARTIQTLVPQGRSPQGAAASAVQEIWGIMCNLQLLHNDFFCCAEKLVSAIFKSVQPNRINTFRNTFRNIPGDFFRVGDQLIFYRTGDNLAGYVANP